MAPSPKRGPPRRWRPSAVAWMVAFALLGCGPAVTILHQTNPSPMRGGTQFAVAPTQVSGATVDLTFGAMAMFRHDTEPFEQYIAHLDPEGVGELNAGLYNLNVAFASRLNSPRHHVGLAAGPPPPGTFVIQARVITYQPEQQWRDSRGYLVTNPARATFHLQFMMADGRPLDEIQVLGYESGMISGLRPASQVFESIGASLGGYVSRYLDERTQ